MSDDSSKPSSLTILREIQRDNFYHSREFNELFAPDEMTKIYKDIKQKGSPTEKLNLIKYVDQQRCWTPPVGPDSGRMVGEIHHRVDEIRRLDDAELERRIARLVQTTGALPAPGGAGAPPDDE